jgi:hypothetical protein
VSHTFYLYNGGTSPLSVSKIKADCSCTGVSEIGEPLAPGDSAAVVVTFKSGRYHGLVRKSVEVTTDDPETPIWHLRIVSHVIKPGEVAGIISITPEKLRLQKDATASDTVRIAADSSDSLAIAVLQGPEGLTLDLPPNITPGETVALAVHKPDDSMPGGPARLSATVLFVGRDTTIITIPIEIEK